MYKYGLTEREFGMGCQPKGFKSFEHSDKSKTGYYSFVWYDRELTKDELLQFTMELIEKS